MKNILRAKTLLVCLSLFALLSCSQDQPAFNGSDASLEDNLLRSPARYQENINGRGDGDHSFMIESVERTGNILSVRVTGGCNPEAFTFIWDGRVGESYPMQAWLVLTLAELPPCTNQTVHDLQLDLSKLQLSQADLDNCVIHLANGSRNQDISIDPDGVVSGL